ncbi:MAG: DUF1549 domain-containing protein [Opitutaceae bacterium]
MTWRLALATAVLSATARAAFPKAPSPFESLAPRVERGVIDQCVFARLAALHIEPARPVSEAAFLRRIHWISVGRLPTAEETRRYLAGP